MILPVSRSKQAVFKRGVLVLPFVLASCNTPDPAVKTAGQESAVLQSGPTDIAPSTGHNTRINGRILPEGVSGNVPAITEKGSGDMTGALPRPGSKAAGEQEEGDITLNYVDADIREICRQILGNILKVNYSIDPGFNGQATIQTTHPLKRDDLLPTLEKLVNQAGGDIMYENGLFRITPSGNTDVVPPVVDAASAGSGSQVVPLRYASAKQLSTMLEPYIGDGAKMLADTGRNALVVTGSVAARANLIDLIRVFDVDYLAGRSYGLFPVRSGDPGKLASDVQKALQIDADGPLSGALSVIPIEQANAIMVVAERPAYLQRASKLIAQINQISDSAGRNLHVYYLKNVQARDLQPLLQRAVNPSGAGGTGETAPGSLSPSSEGTTIGGGGATGSNGQLGGGSNSSGLGGQNGGSGTLGQSLAGTANGGGLGQGAGGTGGNSQTSSLQPDTDLGEGSEVTGGKNGPQIIADSKSNALLIVATESEYAKIESAIRRLDIMPLQVLIEATVAEVTLNDSLEYGTQFFFQHGATQATLSNATSASSTTQGSGTNASLFPGTLAPAFPGFAVARTAGTIQFAIQALKNVTDVRVISSPKLLILDRQEATLQVGDLVPTITQSATNVVTSTAAIVNSVQYQPTGVILNVIPRINSGGLVTLDIEQEVSQVTNTTSSTIDSPTFQQRRVKSKIAVQDGQTISLAGLISDNVSNGNSGIPWLRDLPLLGPLFSTRSHSTQRTELLVLITPRVVYDQHDARVLTDELRRKLTPGSMMQ